MSAHPPRAAHDAAPIARRPKGRSERVQRQVFDAALTILARDGRVGLTMEAIAHEAGVLDHAIPSLGQRGAAGA
ncbi:MAG: hypothetical protein IPG17_28205 [Sandaracinaceae bacterium]|nr:hypothetical protein [Sandaracinaceae bacterium]